MIETRSSRPTPSTATTARESLLARWARWSAVHGWRVVGGWFAVLIGLVFLVATVGGEFVDSFNIPGAESQRAADLLTERFPSQAGDSATLVFESESGVDDPAIQGRIEELLTNAATLPEVTGVVSPYEMPGAISDDGTIAFATVQYSKPSEELSRANVTPLTDLVDASDGDGLRIEAGGEVIGAFEEPGLASTELIGVAAAMVILLIAFGSVIAMGLPILTALIGIGSGFLGIALSAAVFDMNTFTPSFAAMIGLGVGIDYALFIVTRYREGLSHGHSVPESVAQAIDTAGRAVIFAGSVVIIALLGLFAIGIPFIAALGVAAALMVVAAVALAVTLLPALLGLIGRRIDRLRIPGLHAVDTADTGSVSYRWSRLIQRRPLFFTLASAALLLALAAPMLDLELGFTDAGNNPESMRTRRAYDLLSEGFGPGFNGQFLVVVEQDGELAQETLDELSAALTAAPGVVDVAPANLNEAGDTAIIITTPSTAPQDQATSDLVNVLRDDVIAPTLRGSETNAYVGGGTAAIVDVDERISSRMPLFFAIVIGLSFVLLMAVFRSVVIPIKAALMNLLSIGAAYGVLVAVFQWGWFANVFGVDQTGPVESFLPMILFAVLFGLSMDYEVFLLSRVREAFVRSRDSGESVATGLAVTARVISAAAAIMVAVFISFVFGGERVIKEFGLGLAAAIFIDATIVRLILVPATMQLLGGLNWWFPSWLDRLLPRLNIEGPQAHAPELVPVAVPIGDGD
jgi:RND superfamily putative drug exporter